MNSFGIWYVHETWHQLDGFELSNTLCQQRNSFLGFVSEEDMRVFINNIDYSRIFNISQIFKCFLIGLLWKVMHNYHFEIVFSICETDQISDSPMRLHNQVYQFLVDWTTMCGKQFFELFLFFSGPRIALSLQSIETIDH